VALVYYYQSSQLTSLVSTQMLLMDIATVSAWTASAAGGVECSLSGPGDQ